MLETVFRDNPAEPHLRDHLRRIYEEIGAHRELAELALTEADHAGDQAERFAALRRAFPRRRHVLGEIVVFRARQFDRECREQFLEIDCSDAINAGYVTAKLAVAPSGTLVVIDYLQLLDQKRDEPPLTDQVGNLRYLARQRGLIMVFISQIARSYEMSTKPFPDMADLRLPNPLDLTLFDKSCFLNNGSVRFGKAA